MRRVAFGALLAHWRRSPAQLLMLLLGLALATALWSAVQAINTEARASYARAEALLGQDRLARLVPASADMDEARFVALRRAGLLVSPIIEGRLARGDERVRMLGVEPFTLPAEARTLPGGGGDLFALLGETGPLLLAAPATVEQMGAELRAALPGLRAVEGLAPGTVVGDIGQVQVLLGREGRITALVLAPRQPFGVAEPGQLAPDLLLETPEEGDALARLTDSFHLNLTAFGFLAFAVGLFIVHAAIGLAFEQRRAMLRTLRALGVPLPTLMGLLLGELVMLALVAGLVGLGLGWLVAAALLPDVAATLRGLYGAPVAGSLELRPEWALSGLGMALAGTLLAAGAGLWQVWLLPLLAPARPRAWARAHARGRVGRLVLAGGALGAGLAAAQWGTGLVAGFGLLGGILLAAALALPLVLDAALALAERGARRAGPVAQWFWADTRQQVPALGLALAALLLALSANIGVGTMVSSFRLTFTGWLDQRLAAEVYVTARSEAEARRLEEWLVPRTEAVLPIWSAPARLSGIEADVFGVADHATYRENWPLLGALPGVWDLLAGGAAVLVNEQMARRHGLGPGDVLRLPDGADAVIAGIYSDYGNPRAQAMIGLARFEALFPEAPRLAFAARLAPGAVPALLEGLETGLGLSPRQFADQAAVKALSLGIFERTFLVTGALNLLTLGVAGLALLTSLVTLAGLRLPQLAPVWASGLTRAALARLELLRSLALAALTLAAALPLGLVLAWVLLAVVNVEAFGWRLPMHLFPADWGRLGLLTALAVLLAAAWPALGLARIAPARLAKVFADAR